MEIKFEDITDQQCADIVAHFVKRKMVDGINEIVIHAPDGLDIIIITKEDKPEVHTEGLDAACAAACCGMIACI